MSHLKAAAEATAAQLTALGVPITTSPTAIVLPGGWIAPDTVQYNRLDPDHFTVVWSVYLIAPDNGDPLESLGTMLDRLSPHLALPDVDAMSVTLANQSPDPLPAFRFTLETEVTP